jgi:hypothetical protein
VHRHAITMIIPSWNQVRMILNAGRDNSVGIETRYGLNGPGIESQWRRYFPHPSRPAPGPTQYPVQWVPGHFLRGQSGRGVALTTQPNLEPRLKKQWSYTCTPPSGPSRPVLDWTTTVILNTSYGSVDATPCRLVNSPWRTSYIFRLKYWTDWPCRSFWTPIPCSSLHGFISQKTSKR